jgi:protein-tyrosine phosphatase
MVKVLMVCMGNICRSPLAEGILKSKVDDKDIFVDSAGTGGWHIGELPDDRSIQIAEVHQIDITGQRCRKFSINDFDEFDRIYVMDSSNYRDVMALARDDNDERKVEMILNTTHPGSQKDVPDPYYGGENGFKQVFEMLDEACEAIAKDL